MKNIAPHPKEIILTKNKTAEQIVMTNATVAYYHKDYLFSPDYNYLTLLSVVIVLKHMLFLVNGHSLLGIIC